LYKSRHDVSASNATLTPNPSNTNQQQSNTDDQSSFDPNVGISHIGFYDTPNTIALLYQLYRFTCLYATPSMLRECHQHQEERWTHLKSLGPMTSLDSTSHTHLSRNEKSQNSLHDAFIKSNYRRLEHYHFQSDYSSLNATKVNMSEAFNIDLIESKSMEKKFRVAKKIADQVKKVEIEKNYFDDLHNQYPNDSVNDINTLYARVPHTLDRFQKNTKQKNSLPRK
jgi:hypothetical protein